MVLFLGNGMNIPLGVSSPPYGFCTFISDNQKFYAFKLNEEFVILSPVSALLVMRLQTFSALITKISSKAS
jgi:hypothetical protein